MRLSEHCGFLNLRDSLIRDRLILGVKNDRARKKLLEQKDLALDKALDIPWTQELTDIRASDMTTEKANVDEFQKVLDIITIAFSILRGYLAFASVKMPPKKKEKVVSVFVIETESEKEIEERVWQRMGRKIGRER